MSKLDFDGGDNKEYKVEGIWNNAIYTSKNGKLSIKFLSFGSVEELSLRKKY